MALAFHLRYCEVDLVVVIDEFLSVLKRKWDFISDEYPLHGDDRSPDPLGCVKYLVSRDRFPVIAPDKRYNAKQEDQQNLSDKPTCLSRTR